jgi:cobalt-precorrin 5A hydrolase
MKMGVMALTRHGVELACKIGAGFGADVYCPAAFIENGAGNDTGIFTQPITGNFGQFTGKIFSEYQALVFIMACGIVVRSIAPYLKDKKLDPAVVAMDEKGEFVISLLSGHWGKANELAISLAAFTGGQAVLTTATDVNGIIAFDVFARQNNCIIENEPALKQISSTLVNGGSVSLYADGPIQGELPHYIQPGKQGEKGRYAVVLSNSTSIRPEFETVLYLRPGNLILGIGCKKGITKTAIAECLADFLARNQKSPLSLKTIASLDIKAREAGILDYSREQNIPYITIPADEIKKVEDRFSYSPFVKKVAGVGGVAEACAVLGGKNTRLVCPKMAYRGLTFALAEEEQVFTL